MCVCKTEKENQGCIKEDLDEHLRLDSISSYESCSMLHETKNASGAPQILRTE